MIKDCKIHIAGCILNSKISYINRVLAMCGKNIIEHCAVFIGFYELIWQKYKDFVEKL